MEQGDGLHITTDGRKLIIFKQVYTKMYSSHIFGDCNIFLLFFSETGRTTAESGPSTRVPISRERGQLWVDRISFEDIRVDHGFPSPGSCSTTASTVPPIKGAAAGEVLALP